MPEITQDCVFVISIKISNTSFKPTVFPTVSPIRQVTIIIPRSFWIDTQFNRLDHTVQNHCCEAKMDGWEKVQVIFYNSLQWTHNSGLTSYYLPLWWQGEGTLAPKYHQQGNSWFNTFIELRRGESLLHGIHQFILARAVRIHLRLCLGTS